MIRKLTVIGLMSGTSLDGADAALVDFWEESGRTRHRLREFLTLPMPAEFKADLKKLMVAGTIPDLARLNMQVGHFMAEAALAVIHKARIPAAAVDLIGSHGQTIWHDPAKASLQIGESAVIAEATGVTTFCDFRAADIAAGGQGAPLVPYADQELYGEPGRLVGLLNIGGISNLTLLDGRAGGGPKAIMAFDTGPGNVLIDGLCERIWKEPYDRDGHHAHAGQIRPELLRELLAHPFFEQAPPKSTGREVFGDSFLGGVLTRAAALKIKPEDIMATITALTPMAIADAFERFVTERPHAVRVSGGGVHNPVLMRDLGKVLHGIDVTILPDADAKEAVAFALFAYRAAFGQENHVPETTGARRTAILGKLAPGRNFGRIVLEAPAPRPPHGASLDENRRDAGAPGGRQDIQLMVTESRNPATERLDSLSPADLAMLMAEEEYGVTRAVMAAVPDLAAAIATVAGRMQQGGRLYYVGAGTSGRLGVLDASECPPTFSTPQGLVQGIIAGGSEALVRAVEGAEDDWKAGAADFMAHHPSELDTLVGLSASGTAPYVDGALRCAKKLG
ncbi:MAG: anhydro-N-acetylmuramic acid kinase, partial [Candidatus Sericytochromatia bacterium]|nr:anhydro-N-acetylmuramic acid kinase [Candidatus Tanganyikabacteria bacterium]